MNDRELLGKRIKSLRRSKGHTQERLAEIIDVNTNYLAVIERGEANPTLALLERLSAGLEVPLSELFQYRREQGASPVESRQKLGRLVNEASDEELSRLTRVFEALRE
jgi:transcriptional regulator with XRE-family HTH domain